jgi:hypothetical protein
MSEEQAQKIIEMPKKRRTLASREKEEIKYQLSEEVAEDQLIMFLDFYEIRESNFYTEDEKAVYHACLKRVVDAIRKGRVTFNEDGTFDQTLSDGRNVHYGVLKGKAKIQNKAVRNESEDAMRTRRQYAMMGSLSGLGTNAIADFSAVDLGVTESVSFLLTAV